MTHANKDLIRNAGEKSNSLSGFARAVFYALTGEHLHLGLPSVDHTRRDHNGIKERLDVLIYPNPLEGHTFKVQIEDNIWAPSNEYTITVHDILGRLIYNDKTVKGENTITLDDNPSSVLIVNIYKNGKNINTQKLVNIR